MIKIKCKMCGGDITVENNESVVKCDYCDSTQTVPNVVDNEQILALFNRANTLRIKQEFDKAILTYQSIITESPKNAEAHFGMFLCKYGVTYVTDFDGSKKPTINRMQLRSVFDDVDYKEAIALSDVITRRVYEEEATRIANIQKKALTISQNESPYDVFICYKETDENGKRTVDSLIGEQIYNELVNAGYKVFFSRITLEEKLGTEYEPYIFAALNSSKVMLVLGTRPEYFNAVWVKNEWSRFLYLMNESAGSKYLFPCYRDMEAYDLPDEMVALQAQDVNKFGFIQDLLRGINKVFGKKETPQASGQNQSSTSYDGLLRRAKILIEGREYDKADSLLEQVLNIKPEEGRAYLYKILINEKLTSTEQLLLLTHSIESNKNYQLVLKYGTPEDVSLVKKAVGNVQTNIMEQNYQLAIRKQNSEDYEEAIELFKRYPNYKDTKTQIERCNNAILEGIYNDALKLKEKKKYQMAISLFTNCYNYKDSAHQIDECNLAIKEEIYQTALTQISQYSYEKAIETLKGCPNYKDTNEKIEYCKLQITERIYQSGLDLMNLMKYEEAIAKFRQIVNYRDSKFQISVCTKEINESIYSKAMLYINQKDYISALPILKKCINYKDANEIYEKASKLAIKQKKKEEHKKAIKESLKHTIYFYFLGIVALICGIFGAYYFYIYSFTNGTLMSIYLAGILDMVIFIIYFILVIRMLNNLKYSSERKDLVDGNSTAIIVILAFSVFASLITAFGESLKSNIFIFTKMGFFVICLIWRIFLNKGED